MTEPRWCVIHFNLIKSMVLTDITEAKVDELLQIFPKWTDSYKSSKNLVARIASTSWTVTTCPSVANVTVMHHPAIYAYQMRANWPELYLHDDVAR